MEFFCYHRHRPGSGALRDELLEARWTYMDHYEKELIARGPTFADDPAEASANELHEAFPKGFVNNIRPRIALGNSLNSWYALGKSPLRISIERVQSRDHSQSTGFRFLCLTAWGFESPRSHSRRSCDRRALRARNRFAIGVLSVSLHSSLRSDGASSESRRSHEEFSPVRSATRSRKSRRSRRLSRKGQSRGLVTVNRDDRRTSATRTGTPCGVRGPRFMPRGGTLGLPCSRRYAEVQVREAVDCDGGRRRPAQSEATKLAMAEIALSVVSCCELLAPT